ncbi:MAG: PIG-L family deacetylase, partial [Deltaproteobacteria bacterium]|nr:PIG-L family deacetylase [Deltaproteobacteria bacterium]
KINVDDTWEMKFEAVAQHKSQFSPDELALMRGYFEMKAAEYAGDKGFRLGEAFKVLHPLQLHCFVDAWKS